MSAGTVSLLVRNAADNGWERVEVPVGVNRALRTDLYKRPICDGIPGPGTALTTAGAGTLTAAILAGGVILRDPNGAGRTDTTDTAANIVADATMGLDADYKEYSFYIINTADANETITLAGGSGVTLQGSITIAQNSMTRLTIFRVSSTAVVIRQT